jgi:hypothetical protein
MGWGVRECERTEERKTRWLATEPMVLVSDKPMNFIVLNGRIVMVMHFLQTGRKRHTFPGTEEPMSTLDFITALFDEIDEQMGAIPTHPEAHLWPSEVLTLGLVELSRRVTPLDWSPKPCLPVS